MMVRVQSKKALPVKLEPWNSSIWNPVDSVVVVSILLLPLPTRGCLGASGFELDFPMSGSIHLARLL